MTKKHKKFFSNLNRLNFFSLVFLLFLFILFIPVISFAAFPEVINYQGKLMDSSGNLVADDSYNMRFRLCADSDCASVLYDESWVDSNKVAVTNGLFSVLIGSVSSTLDSVDFNQDTYLEVSIGGTGVPSWEVLTPRKKLGAVPNALNAQKFGGLATSSFLRSDTTNTSSIINNLTSTNIFSNNASITSVTSTNLFTAVINALSAIIDNLTASLANITTLVFDTATGNNLATTNLNVTSTASIKDLNASSSVVVNSTSTNFYSSNAVITGGTIASSTISGLTVTNFASPNISQWTNDAGYLTSYVETDPLFMAASTSLPYQPIGSYLTTETDPIWSAVSSSYLTIVDASSTYLAINAASTTLWDTAYGIVIASSSNWESFYNTPSTRITAGTGLTWDGNTLNEIFWSDNGVALTPATSSRGLTINGTTSLATTTISGNLGIGTVNPQTALEVIGTSTLDKAVIGYGSIIGNYINGSSNNNYLTINEFNLGGGLIKAPYQTSYMYYDSISSTIKNINNFEYGLGIVNNLDLGGAYSIFGIYNDYDVSNNLSNLIFDEKINDNQANFIFNGNISVGATSNQNYYKSLQKIADNLELPHKLRNLYIADHYVYAVTYATNSVDSFRIIDIADPAHPKVVGGAGLTGLVLSDAKRVWASGNYAYILYNATGGIDNPFRIIDISDKSNPRVISGENLHITGIGGSAGQPFYISGKYAYIMGYDSMHIIDISDPYNPKLVSTLNNVGDTNWDIKVVGDYAYVCSRKIIGGEANPLTIVNIKDKTNPFIVKELTIPDLDTSTNLCWSLDVSGGYVYLGMGTLGMNSSTESFRIVDVSNPNNPVVKGGRDIGTNSNPDLALPESYSAFNYVKALGNRLYATTWWGDFLVIDISSSTNPEIISKTSIIDGGTNMDPLTFDFNGNYVAIGYAPILPSYTTSTDYFRIFKMTGVDTLSGHADAFSAGSLQVLNNAVFNQRLTVWDSLEIGSGGLYSQGPIAVMATNTPNYFGGSLNIGTTSSTGYKLSVFASNTTDYLIQVATSTNSGIFEIRNDGIGRFGGDLIIGGNSTVNGNLIVSGTGTSTIAGNLQIAQGKVLQVETITAYSPLNINTGMIVNGNVTTTGTFTVNTGNVSNIKTSQHTWDLGGGIVFNLPMLEGTIEDVSSAGLLPNNILTVKDYLGIIDVSNSGHPGVMFSANNISNGNITLTADFVSSTLMVSGNLSQNIYDYNDNTYWDLGLETTPWNNLWLRGNASILTLDTNGAVYSNNGVLTNVNPSSGSYKHDIASTTLNIDALLGLQVKSFVWNNNNQPDFGLIAEEVKEALPELYLEDGTTKGYRADHLPFYLLQIAQRQESEIKSIKNTLSVTELNTDDKNLTVTEAQTFTGTIIVIGEAGFKSKVTFGDHVYFTKDAAGIAVIQSGATSTEIKFSKPYETAPIITITPKKKLSGVSWWVENETSEGFIIAIDPTIEQEIQFNWHAVAVDSSDSDTINESNIKESSSTNEEVSNSENSTETVLESSTSDVTIENQPSNNDINTDLLNTEQTEETENSNNSLIDESTPEETETTDNLSSPDLVN